MMKILTLVALTLSLSMVNAGSLLGPDAADGRIAKKNPSAPIGDVIEDIKARMEARKAVATRMESRFGWPFNLFMPEPKGSYQRSKAAVTTTSNDY